MMLSEYRHLLAGLPILYLIVVVAMLIVVAAMAMDALSGWHKAKERGEERTSYLFSRSIDKFLHYEGGLFICAGIDTLIHFVWAQFINSAYCVPVITCAGGIVLCVVEIWSVNEKADKKTRKNITHAIGVVADALNKEKSVEIAKHIIDKASDNEKGGYSDET